jgi:L-lactate dehydrogenase (cytochrome)/glycolate oxidase
MREFHTRFQQWEPESIEDVASAAPDGRNWFQLYMWKDRERSMALVDRAKASGFDTLVLTVDVPVCWRQIS